MAENLVAPNYDKLTSQMNKYSNGLSGNTKNNRASEGSARMTKWQEVFLRSFHDSEEKPSQIMACLWCSIHGLKSLFLLD